MNTLKYFIAKVADGASLDRKETEAAFSILMSGEATPAQMGGFLMALRTRGESIEELVGALSVMRDKMLFVDAPVDAIDIVGTGGDSVGTYNISTCAAIVAAGAGVKVAKHGNRSLSSKSGSAEVLAALGVNLELSPGQISDCIEEAGIGFMFAPAHHSAMQHVGPTRVELGTRTIFNLLGPICNPARVKRQLLGVFSPKWLLPIAKTLAELDSQKVWAVHGGGLDELTITGASHVAALENGNISTFDITPQDGGLPTHDIKEILGGDIEYNATAITRVLDGEPGAFRDIALLNAGAAMIIADQAENLADGVDQSAQAIDTGKARKTLDALVRVSNQGKP